MPEKIHEGDELNPLRDARCVKENVCIHTKKVYDSCKDKDCLTDLRLYPTCKSQEILDKAINIKPRKAELLWVYTDVEPVPFDEGFFTVDIKCFYKVTLDAFVGVGRPCEVTGIATYGKRVILFGSEGSIRIFSSEFRPNGMDSRARMSSNLPTAVVEAVEPILLAAKLVDVCDCRRDDICEMPDDICSCLDDDIVLTGGERRAFVTIGQFSIVRLERSSQILVPSFDFCMPEKECVGSEEGDPCSLFEKLKFPVDQFFPPDEDDFRDDDFDQRVRREIERREKHHEGK